jgi:GTPase SAR1 family protein
LEAKREGNYFELPEGTKNLEYSLHSLCRDNSDFKLAIEQVCNYCQDRGVEIAMVSNGWQLVAFIANRSDGIPPLKGNAIIFSSLIDMYSQFQTFWNLFSKPAFEKKNLRNKLLGEVLPELPPKLSTTIKPYPGIKNRNNFQTNMQVMSDLILEDVIRYEELEETFLQECYCSAGALSHYSFVSKDMLRTRYEYLFEKNDQPITVQSITNKKGISDDFKEVAAQSISRRPILLIGDVGVGKTSFIKNLIKVEAKIVFEKAITFKIDLGSQIVLALDIREAIIDEIINQLYTDHNIDIFENNFVKGVYDLEFERFKKGIYRPYFESSSEKAIEKSIEFFEEKVQNKSNHLRHSILHIAKARRKQVVIFIDNCDQRDYNTQQTAFLISQELAENWHPVTVFTSLRPETFHNSLRKGTLSGYHPKAFTIAPPRVDLVIQKRLFFARKIARGEIPVAKIQGKVELISLVELLSVVIYSFERNEDLYTFIDNISAGNIRLAIDIVRNFFGSGHVNTQKILRINGEENRYIISLHEFLRAVIFGDNVYYDSESSYIYNVFDVRYVDEKEHFLTLILMSILQSKMNSGKDNGYLETIKLSNHLQGLGFNIDQIDTCMSISIRKNLIETSAKGTAYDNTILPLAVRITTTGAYHLNNLPNLFVYLDAIIVDTPIFDDYVRGQIQDVEMIDARIKRGKIFLNYLDKIWMKFILGKSNVFLDWNLISAQVKKDMERIEKRFSIEH